MKSKEKYALYLNGVLYEKFRTIKEIDEYLFNQGIENNDRYYIEVKKI